MGEASALEETIVDIENQRAQRTARTGGSSGSSDVTLSCDYQRRGSDNNNDDDDDDDDDDDENDERDNLTRSLSAVEALEAIDAAANGDHDDIPPTPRFLQDSGSWRYYRWIPYPVRRFGRAAAKWSKGPADAHDFRIVPVFPAIQEAPLRLLDQLIPPSKAKSWRWRWGLYYGWLGLWLLTFSLVYRHGLAASEVGEWGTPGDIGCGNTYWVPGNLCGLDGSECRPFNGTGFAFKCPAGCLRYKVLNPRAVGDQEIVYKPLVIGGPGSGATQEESYYRGDSFICSAAIHAGVVSNEGGGCGVVRLVGRQSHFASSKHNEIHSVGFDSYFPLAFSFDDNVQCSSTDMRWPLLAISVVFSSVLSLFVASPAPFFFGVFTGVFWHVGLASDPPPHSTVTGLLSDLLGKFLPAMLAAWVIFDKMGVRRTLRGLTAQIEKTVLWLGALWTGALTNVTFDTIPIQRLTPHDLAQQPGAKAALTIIVLVLLAIVASQVWYFRQEGRMRRYLKVYILFCAGLLLCVALPNLNLRIHHYILALLLLPGTSMQTRPALLYQGLLVGFFINGTARWGWASLLETSSALQGDAQLDSPLPELLSPVIEMAGAAAATAATAATSLVGAAAAIGVANYSSITFRFKQPADSRYDGISVLVNDVERFRGYFGDTDLNNNYYDVNDEVAFVWKRPTDGNVDEFFRFGFMEGSTSDDYTKAGIWNAAGEWVDMKPGPSRVKSRSLDGEKK